MVSHGTKCGYVCSIFIAIEMNEQKCYEYCMTCNERHIPNSCRMKTQTHIYAIYTNHSQHWTQWRVHDTIRENSCLLFVSGNISLMFCHLLLLLETISIRIKLNSKLWSKVLRPKYARSKWHKNHIFIRWSQKKQQIITFTWKIR